MLSTMAAVGEKDIAAAWLTEAAREAWIGQARGQRWTVWARLSWSWTVSEDTAARQVEAWATRLRERVPGSAVLVGLHTDTSRVHAHALVFIPQRWHEREYPTRVRVVGWSWDAWLRWRHGNAWTEPYSPGRTDRQHGAAAYLAREVGTVMQYGKAPSYSPRRRR